MMRTPRGAAAVALALVLALAASAAAAPPATDPADDYDALLRADVRAGVVDWAMLRQRDLPRLDIYLDRLARVDAAALPPADRVAFWLNLYNATFLRAAAGRAGHGWSPADGNFIVFHQPLVHTLAGEMSLDSLERGVLRPAARDPRVHVALYCGARSCPPLLSRAYRGVDLNATLADNMRRFVRDPARNRIDREHRTLTLSRIFDWYAADFGGPAAVPAYVGQFAGEHCEGWKVVFLDYDWRLGVAGAR
jgi:hypothetical protein